MYDTTTPLDLNYMNQQHLPRRYDSEEEEISESEIGGHDHGFSPVDTSKATGVFDLDMSGDETSNVSMNESNMNKHFPPQLLSPFPSTGRPSRPVSMDTVKRSSGATFVTDPYNNIFDDDSIIIALPSPDSTTPLQSPVYLQPAVYVPSEPLSSPRNSSFRSSSPSSVYTDDESDIFMAEQVSYVELNAKPSLILISPTTGQSSPVEESASPASSNGSVYSLEQAAKSQPLLGETSMDRGRSRYQAQLARGNLRMNLTGLEAAGYPSMPTMISKPYSSSDAEMPQSIRSRSGTFSRPRTSFAESSPSLLTRPRPHREDYQRPPSVQSTATFSLFPTVQTRTPPFTEESHSRSMSCSHSTAGSEYSISSQTSQPPSRSPSPTPYHSHSFNRSRSGSLYSLSSLSPSHQKRPPLPYRGSVIKGSGTLNGYSSSSLRSEIENTSPVEPPQPVESEIKPKSRRKKSLRHIRTNHSKTESPEISTAKSFVGFMLRGKRKSGIKNSNA